MKVMKLSYRKGQGVLLSVLRSILLPFSLRLQIAQSRSYLHTLGPKVGIIYVRGALGFDSAKLDTIVGTSLFSLSLSLSFWKLVALLTP